MIYNKIPEQKPAQICYIQDPEEELMRVNCPHCNQKALITSSNRLSATVTDLYCQCQNTQHCGASFVFSLAFKHNLNPPHRTTREIAASLLATLPRDELMEIQRDLFRN